MKTSAGVLFWTIAFVMILVFKAGSQTSTVKLSTDNGGSWTDYSDISSAYAAIGTVSQPCIIELQSGYTGSTETYPILLTSLTGASVVNTITIRPAASGLVISSDSTIATIDINSGSFIVIDGRVGGSGSTPDLMIRNTRVLPTGAPTIRFINDAVNNMIKYCVIKGGSNSASSGVVFFSSTSATNGNDNNTLDHCNLTYYSGSLYPLNLVYSNGTSGKENSSNIVSNCNFYDYALSGTAISVHTNNSSWTITGNSIYRTLTNSAPAGTMYGIYVNNTGSNYSIRGNFIGGSTNECGGSAWTQTTADANRLYCIYLTVGGTSTSTISDNIIKNFNWKTTYGSSFYGIYSTSGRLDIGTTGHGNIIGDTTTTASITINNITASGNNYGIYSSNSSAYSTNLVGNKISGITTSGSSSYYQSFGGIYFSSNGSAANNISNNLVGSRTIASSINLTATSGNQTFIGLQSYGAGSTTVAGNFIGNITNLSASGTGSSIGISCDLLNSPLTISGNVVMKVNVSNPGSSNFDQASFVGIKCFPQSNGAVFTIKNNKIYGISNLYNGGIATLTGIATQSKLNSALVNQLSYNQIHSFSFTYATGNKLAGIFFNYDYTYTTGGYFNVFNNVIRLGIKSDGSVDETDDIIYGIYEAINGIKNYYFNSIYIGGSFTSGTQSNNTYAFYSVATPTFAEKFLKNNILVNARSRFGGTAKHYAFRLQTFSFITDYNLYYTPGTGGTLALIGSVDYTTLQDLRFNNQPFSQTKSTIYYCDKHSVTADPDFVNPTGNLTSFSLKIQNNSPAEEAGDTLYLVTDDFEADSRASLTPVDIGADAGNYTVSADINPPSIYYSRLMNSSSLSTRTVNNFALIEDIGGSGLNSSTSKPRIYFKKSTDNNSFGTYPANNNSSYNGWKYAEATGTTSPFSFIIDYSLIFGGSIILGDVIQYFVVAQDQATTPNVTFQPVAGASGTVSSVVSAPSTPYSYSIVGSISGTLTVGSSGAMYTSLTKAAGVFSDLNSKEITGNVTIQITSNLTNENGVYSLVAANKANPSYRIKIVPNSNTLRTISGSPAGYHIINIDSADFVNIDGRYNGSGSYLRFQNTATFYSVFRFLNGATYDTIQYCTIEGGNSVTTYGTVTFGASNCSEGNNYNVITHCDIKEYNSGNLPVYGVYSNSGSGNYCFNRSNSITYCNISNYNIASFNCAGIFLEGMVDSWIIEYNSFFQTSARNRSASGSYNTYGIYIGNSGAAGSGFKVNHNFIGGSGANCTGTWTLTSLFLENFRGIWVYAGPVGTSEVQYNKITHISWQSRSVSTSLDGGLFCGIYNRNGSFNICCNTIGAITGNDSIVITNTGASGSHEKQISTGIFVWAFENGLRSTVTNNVIGGIKATSSFSSNPLGFIGIYVPQIANAISFQSIEISYNLIGSTSTSNSIRNGYYDGSNAESAELWGIYSQNPSTDMKIRYNTIANLTNNTSGGSYSEPLVCGIITTYGSNEITWNHIYNLKSNSTFNGEYGIVTGIYASSADNDRTITVSNNTIHGLESNAGSSGNINIIGIIIGRAVNTTLSFNKIYDFKAAVSTWMASTTSGLRGIMTITDNNQPLNIFNNFISLGDAVTTDFHIFGILHSNNFSGYIAYNSVIISGTVTPNLNLYTMAYFDYSSSTVNVKNNIFINLRSGGTGKHYAIATPSSASLTSNYNNLYSANPANLGSYDNGATPRSFSAWQSVGYDANSLNSTVTFTDVANGDLHTSTSVLSAAATPLSSFLTDYDFEPRNPTTPDIGADEFGFGSTSWTGSVSSAWNNASNWSNGIPLANTDVLIPGSLTNYPEVGDSNGIYPLRQQCKKLKINNGAKVTIFPKSSLTANDTVLLNGSTCLVVRSTSAGTGNFLDNGIITGTGSAKIQRYLEKGVYHYVSSPVQNGNTSMLTGISDIYQWSEVNHNWGGTQPVKYSGSMVNAKGYAAVDKNNSYARNFIGIPNTGQIDIAVTRSHTGYDIDRGWNLVGNPYPSSINLAGFIAANNANSGIINQTISCIIYLWDEDTTGVRDLTDYSTWSFLGSTSGNGRHQPIAYAQPGQAFVVHRPDLLPGSRSVTFNNSMRCYDTLSNFFVPDVIPISRFKMALTGNINEYNEILIGFAPFATDGYDYFDGYKLKGNPLISLYSLLGNDEMVTQGMSPLTEDKHVAVGFYLANSGNFTMKKLNMENFPTEFQVILEDKYQQKTFNFNKGTDYLFPSDSGTFNDRFVLHFIKSGVSVPDKQNNSGIILRQANGNLWITLEDPATPASLVVYDLLGKVIFKDKLPTGLSSINYTLPPAIGYFLVKVVQGNHYVVDRFFIK